MAEIRQSQGKFLLAADQFLQALALDPNDPDTLQTYSNTLAELGYLKLSLEARQHLQAVEPYVPVFNRAFARILWADGQTDAAIALYKSPATANASPELELARIYAYQGHYDQAADLMQSNETAAHLLRTAPSVAASAQTLPPLGREAWVYLYVGAPQRVLEYLEGSVKAMGFFAPDLVPLWSPPYAPIRKTERFKAFVRAAGMVDYWKAKG